MDEIAPSTVSADLQALYEGYYGDAQLARKRAIAARDSVDHLAAMAGTDLGDLLDVGAGNGSVLSELARRNMCRSLSAVEISATGLEGIRSRNLPGLATVASFDGYRLPFPDRSFDTVICIHVLEHVEHERLFLKELARVGRRIAIEVPLEGGLRGRIFRRDGHINYYVPKTFRNLLETSGLRIVADRVFTSSGDYERLLSGGPVGTGKNLFRRSVLALGGSTVAPNLMTYLQMAVCVPENAAG